MLIRSKGQINNPTSIEVSLDTIKRKKIRQYITHVGERIPNTNWYRVKWADWRSALNPLHIPIEKAECV